ncbi:serine protease [Pedobacter frigiditerrae]|uniref:Serine protease n=1 Tax=Pedobacter frigiditerrae TaxID=2530452 RepID=A0A4R0ML63_9SPHI|nr:trypsin-like peptidase domain-containing protein [Pedobacter frigiditerrae]TCC87263.1 serine protease [Pedobacter frigiditerrae]
MIINKIKLKVDVCVKLNRLLSLVSLILLACCLTNVSAQQKETAKAQTFLDMAIQKAYAASVRIWGFDVEKNERTSAQFSGVVVNEKGIILTAAHTISPGRTYKIFFPDGRAAIAKALGRIDLAATPGIPDAGMLQLLDKGPFPFVEMGFSSLLKTNDPCISISYPEKINLTLPTLRYGNIAEVKNEYGFIRSTCKMEPGDSGGALFDQYGRLIGIHSAIDVKEDQNFEIPIDIYHKYWTALQEVINYSKYPIKEDNYSPNKAIFADKAITIDAIVAKNAIKLAKVKNTVLALTSKIDGLDSEAMGTIINYFSLEKTTEQFILSKNSIVGDLPILNIEGLKIRLHIVKRDLQNDLILLKADKNIKGGVNIDASKNMEVKLGGIVVALLPDGKYQRGIIGNEPLALEKNSSIPYLGASILFKSSPAAVTVVKPGSPAALAGIQTGDFIMNINGVNIKQANEFAPELAKYWAGEEVTIEWLRADQKYTKSIKLVNKPFVASKHPVDKFAGGGSERRDGFKQVFTFDAILLPKQSAVPVFSLNGQFLGINIARYSRAISLGIPYGIIVDFLKEIPSLK